MFTLSSKDIFLKSENKSPLKFEVAFYTQSIFLLIYSRSKFILKKIFFHEKIINTSFQNYYLLLSIDKENWTVPMESM